MFEGFIIFLSLKGFLIVKGDLGEKAIKKVKYCLKEKKKLWRVVYD